MYFPYTDAETEYLKSRDPKLAEVIDALGHIDREMDDDLFPAVIHHIVAQQISAPALKTVWSRLQGAAGSLTPESIHTMTIDDLQSCGMTFRKAEYIKDFADQVYNGSFDLTEIQEMSDEEAIRKLSSLRGIGVWTAEMILLFSLGRKNIFAYDDLAVQRGLRMVYHHRRIDRKLFERYRRRFSPYCSIASLYLWKVAAGGIPELKDHAPKKKRSIR